MATLSSRDSRLGLFPELATESSTYTTGVLPAQNIQELIRAERVVADLPIDDAQVQPASMDLRLGPVAYRVQASFLPGRFATVMDRIKALGMAELDLSKPAVLEKGCIYIVPVLERLNLPADTSARANPKSTTGRLDIFTRLITDYGIEFEQVPAGYSGQLYIEIVSRTFTVILGQGTKLNQLRFIRGKPGSHDSVVTALHEEEVLVYTDEDSPAKAQIDKGLKISMSLQGDATSDVVAYKARKNSPALDLSKVNYYPAEEFWDAVREPKNKAIILDPGDFYILGSKERVRVPPEFAAEMVAFDPSMGEFRIHYAGFFDPGFGYGISDIKGTRAVLEVRAHEVPFLVEDGQIVGRLQYMRLLSRPGKIYGLNIGSSYQSQVLALSKQFRKPY
ncbi:MAG: 2'-deoxycytidine 5'-triphosphate deaminase [Acidobacteria bacterium]|nr:MAG: 2'-deoxycytidine 5'-triphosphate deaminase [Acidobacteriota bacterium]